jgi:hypothetical protein
VILNTVEKKKYQSNIPSRIIQLKAKIKKFWDKLIAYFPL